MLIMDPEPRVRMRRAAARQGVELKVVSAGRTPSHQARLRQGNKNAHALAQGVSAHSYGLAIDLAMSPGAGRTFAEVTTRPFSNVLLMRAAPAHKWMVLFGEEFGFYPYTHEPWHWEYNPPGLSERFP